MAGFGKYAGLGLQFAIAILLFLMIGEWLDRKFGTDPLFLYVGVFTGAGAAFYAMYRGLMADQRKAEQEEQEEREEREEREEQDKRDKRDKTEHST